MEQQPPSDAQPIRPDSGHAYPVRPDPGDHPQHHDPPPQTEHPPQEALFEPPPPQPAPADAGDPAGQGRQPRRDVGPLPPRRIIALANQKGGVGKTTSTLSLAACLAQAGRRVLIVDVDPQGGCAVGLGFNPGSLDATVYNLLLQEGVSAQDVLLKTKFDGLELIPSNIDLAAAELLLVQEVAREHVLKRALDPLRAEYDFILLDCPPSLGLLTINALTAADTVIVPLECEYFALRGVGMLMDTLRKVQERLNHDLKVEGILATMYDARTLHSREVLDRVREAFSSLVFQTVIPKTIRFAEAPVAGEPIASYAPTSAGAEGYRQLAREVLQT